VPFVPPSVAGWPQNSYWLTTASAGARLRLAEALVQKADISAVKAAATDKRLDAVARLLSVDGWEPATAKALQQVADDPVVLTAVALVSPEYVVA
jgi:hypothetical protein